MTYATTNPVDPSSGMGVARAIAALGSLGAAAIHFAAAPNHYAEWWPAGVFFVLLGVLQGGWAVAALVSASRVVFGAGLVINLGAVATWVLSRTVGVPVGPAAGVPEDITRAGLTALAFESVICLIALDHLLRRSATRSAVRHWEAVALAAAGALAVGFAMPAVATAMSHSHGPSESSHSEEHGGDDDESTPDCRSSDGPAPEEGASPTPLPETSPSPSEAVPPDETADHDNDEPHGH